MLLLLALLALWESAAAEVVGAYVLPHGGIALNPSRFHAKSRWAKQWAWQIHRAAVEVGKHIESQRPDLVLLSTPHGVADLHRFTFYQNSNASGSATTDNCECPPCCYEVNNVRLAAEEAATLASELGGLGLNVSGLSFFGPPGSSEPATLRWGVVIPLIFLKDLSSTRVLVLSHPSRRYNHSRSMIPELLNLGGALWDRLEAMPGKVAVVVSADLAHTHDPDGPYGFSPAALPFDRACGDWARSLHPYYLLDKAASLVDDAKSCGFTGLVMLHGLLSRPSLSSWAPALHANYYPSYYGMMVASFKRKPHKQVCPNCTPENNKATNNLK